jgi:hypothetical protein
LEIVTSPGGRDGLRILVLKGRLTIETVASFQDAIRKEHAQELIVDMSGVPSMDSAGLFPLLLDIFYHPNFGFSLKKASFSTATPLRTIYLSLR